MVVAIDQGVKAASVALDGPGERTDLALGFDLTRVMNSGIAFGLFSEGSDAVVLAFTAVALALIVGWFAFDTDAAGAVARRRPAGRRRARQPRRSDLRRRGHRLHRPAALAGLQRRRHRDHARRRRDRVRRARAGARPRRRAVSAEPPLVHVDERLAVVDKPAGLVVHPAPGHRGETLVSVLGELLGGGEEGAPGDRPPPRQGHQRA